MFSIYDGRNKFYQWDKDRKLIVEDKTITQVHFANCFCPNARVCEVSDGLVDVPNELLTEDLDIRVWGYDGGMTKHEQVFEVERRVKPADYIYTQTDVWTVEKAVEEALADLDMSEYVKKTDYATKDIGGVVKVDDRYGTRMVNGVIDICAANNSQIDSRTVHLNSLYSAGHNFRHPIVPSNLDYAVKKALSDCKLGNTEAAWTDEEKAAARTLLGVNIEDALDAIIAIQESLIGGNA